ncbi:MAG: apolipoprotein N-acyltransferase [Francisella sp.]|jgi:apolipoprotein N-acyltransferase
MKKISLQSLFPFIITFLSGAALVFAFAPFRLDVIAIVSLCVFFYFLSKCNKYRYAFLMSFIFGLGFFGTSISWVYISIHLFTQSMAAGLTAAVALVILLSFLHTIPFGVFSYALTHKSSNYIKLLVYPALWTLFEIVKANLLWGGFPWVSLGYSQTESPLIWYSSIGGVYFVTYLLAFIAVLITFYILPLLKTNLQSKITICKLILAIVAIIVIYIGGIVTSKLQPSETSNQNQKVVLVQGDFIQGFKWDNANFVKMQSFYEGITKKYKNTLIILSENAIPAYRQYQTDYFSGLKEIADKNNNAILVGSLSNADNKVLNSSIILGKGNGTYNKHHLVPFGEYFPIKFFGYVDSAGLSNFDAGDKIQPIMSAFGSPLANFICYEVGYPEQVRDQLQGASIISVISDDSWFGDSIARDQQLQISQVRAIENDRYVLTTTSNGITSVIKPNGEIEKQLAKDTRGTLEATVYNLKTQTVWLKIGMALVFLLIIGSIVIVTVIKVVTRK